MRSVRTLPSTFSALPHVASLFGAAQSGIPLMGSSWAEE